MKTVRITASIEIEYQVDDYVEVDDSLVDDIIGYQKQSEVIAEVQNNASWHVEEG